MNPTDPTPSPSQAQDDNETPRWAVVELMGHIRTGGRVSKDTMYGTPMLRLDIPQTAEPDRFVTQLVNASALYRLTFCDEAIARAAASRSSSHQPIDSWTLRDALGLPDKSADQSEDFAEIEDDSTDDIDSNENPYYFP